MNGAVGSYLVFNRCLKAGLRKLPLKHTRRVGAPSALMLIGTYHLGARESAVAAASRVKRRSQTRSSPALNPVTLPAWSRWKTIDVAPPPLSIMNASRNVGRRRTGLFHPMASVNSPAFAATVSVLPVSPLSYFPARGANSESDGCAGSTRS